MYRFFIQGRWEEVIGIQKILTPLTFDEPSMKSTAGNAPVIWYYTSKQIKMGQNFPSLNPPPPSTDLLYLYVNIALWISTILRSPTQQHSLGQGSHLTAAFATIKKFATSISHQPFLWPSLKFRSLLLNYNVRKNEMEIPTTQMMGVGLWQKWMWYL